MNLGSKRDVCAALALFAVGCGNGSRAKNDGGVGDARGTATDARHPDPDAMFIVPSTMDANTIPSATADAGACPVSRYDSPGFVCFAADPEPYRHYLAAAAGVEVGQCPRLSDFPVESATEGSCANLPCGPLLPSAISDKVDGGGVDAGAALCCFWVRFICGVKRIPAMNGIMG